MLSSSLASAPACTDPMLARMASHQEEMVSGITTRYELPIGDGWRVNVWIGQKSDGTPVVCLEISNDDNSLVAELLPPQVLMVSNWMRQLNGYILRRQAGEI
jgi:hypothetical protein